MRLQTVFDIAVLQLSYAYASLVAPRKKKSINSLVTYVATVCRLQILQVKISLFPPFD